jgi:hypothetical protein
MHPQPIRRTKRSKLAHMKQNELVVHHWTVLSKHTSKNLKTKDAKEEMDNMIESRKRGVPEASEEAAKQVKRRRVPEWATPLEPPWSRSVSLLPNVNRLIGEYLLPRPDDMKEQWRDTMEDITDFIACPQDPDTHHLCQYCGERCPGCCPYCGRLLGTECEDMSCQCH